MTGGNSITLSNGKESCTQREANDYFKNILNSVVAEVFETLVVLTKYCPK